MTQIRFNYVNAYGTASTGSLAFMPHRRHAANETTILPKPFAIHLHNGERIVDLQPSDVEWVWMITERINNTTNTWFATIPDQDGTIEHTELIHINPSSLPAAYNAVEPAWWAEHRQYQKLVGDTVTTAKDAITEAENTLASGKESAAQAHYASTVAKGYRDESLQRATESREARDESRAARDEAQTHRTGAETARTQSQGYATDSATYRDQSRDARDMAQQYAGQLGEAGWWRDELRTTGGNLDDMTGAAWNGKYVAHQSTVGNPFGESAFWVEIQHHNTTNSTTQTATRSSPNPKTLTRVYWGGGWSEWESATQGYEWYKPKTITGDFDADTLIEPGVYNTSSTRIQNQPYIGNWSIVVFKNTGAARIQVWYSWNNPGDVYYRSYQNNAWGSFRSGTNQQQLDGILSEAKTYADQLVDNIPSPSVEADIGVHQHAQRLSRLRQKVGAPRLQGRGAVTLICDHGTNNFASRLLPELRTAGLGCTLSLNSQMYDTHADENDETTWSQIREWARNDNIEIANHGRTHADVSGNAALKFEIEGGRIELEENLPGVEIDTYVQVGTPSSGGQFDGFRDGLTHEAYWETYAGRIIRDSHALFTGQVPVGQRNDSNPRIYPMDGHPKQGASGYWIDRGGSSLDDAKQRIDLAVDQGRGVILRLHPRVIGMTNMITQQEIIDLVQYLKQRQDNDELLVLPFREWSLAVEW